jgi:hypothetical protein
LEGKFKAFGNPEATWGKKWLPLASAKDLSAHGKKLVIDEDTKIHRVLHIDKW